MTTLQKILNLYKEEGETPLERLNRLRKSNPDFADLSMSYLGRLDPMAKGVLVVLAGDTVSNRKEILGADKEYKFRILLGVDTDTHDILGLVQKIDIKEIDKEKLKKLPTLLRSLRTIRYPLFSSKTLGGKPLFEKARAGEINENNAPTRNVKIYNFEIISDTKITGGQILQDVQNRIKKVSGDFRQDIILGLWEKEMGTYEKQVFTLLECKSKVSTGTYIRRLAQIVGEHLGTGGIAYEIIRTRVGEYKIKDSIH